ncbi:MAG: hypothetical protein ACRELC_01060 [Gemmatimonadota bacterium]
MAGGTGRAALYALPLMAGLAMLGLVLAANPARWGVAGAMAGVALAAGATLATVFLFRRAGRSRPDSGHADPSRPDGGRAEPSSRPTMNREEPT